MPASIASNLRASATRWPERIAISSGDTHVSYSALWQQATGIASYLASHGLQSGERVALVLNNCPEAAAILYGVLLAGGIAVPLNAAAKSRDFRGWLQHSTPRFLFTRQEHGEVLECLPTLEGDVSPVLVGSAGPWETMASSDGVLADECRANGADPALILYTSGTTGSPKGVLLSHENLSVNTSAIVQYLGLTERDSVVSVLPFYYSYGSSVLHTHMAVGGRVILEQNLVYPQHVVRTLEREKAAGFAGVPSTYSLLLSRVRLADYNLTSLRYVTQAGGAMSPELTRKVRRAFSGAKLFVMYGQTEATARLTWLPPERLDEKIGSVGIPVEGVVVEVRREDGSPAPCNETGEVWVQGRNVMQGYWANPEATSAVLREGWLSTGDLGYLDSDGYLYLAGRRSDIIKTGAHRVHPQDIEDTIQEIDGVAEVAVVGVADEALGEAIKAVVVLDAGTKVDPMQIKSHCRARLANYKVPKVIEFREVLPKTDTGKLRRRDLA